MKQADGAPTSRKNFRFLLIFAFWFLACAAAYCRTNVTFLRAESGWLQIVAHDSPAGVAKFESEIWKSSYGGHYVPITLWLELKQTQFVGLQENYWKWRAITLIAILATITFSFFRFALVTSGASDRTGSALAFAVVSLLIFQPAMFEFVAWPFLVLQLGWMILTVGAFYACARFLAEPKAEKWLWVCIIAAYGSMHCAGLGLATVVAIVTVLVLAKIALKNSLVSPRFGGPLIFLAIFGALHLLAMRHVGNEPPQNAPHMAAFQIITQATGLLMEMPVFSAVALIEPLPLPPFYWQIIRGMWPFGDLFLIVFAGIAWTQWRRWRENNGESSIAFAAALASFIILLVVAGMIALREFRYPTGPDLLRYVSGPRYIVPVSFALIGFLLAAVIPLARKCSPLILRLSLLVGLCAFISQRIFEHKIYPQLFPSAQISHRQIISLLDQAVEQSKSAHLPMPNVYLTRVAEFAWTADRFSGVLHDDLKMSVQEKIQFAPIAECLGARRAEYEAQVPALRKLTDIIGEYPKN